MRFNLTRKNSLCLPGSPGRSGASRLARLFLWLVLASAFAWQGEVHAQSAKQREYEIKAAYLYNFINYIEWPADALPAAGGTITIGIFGESPFGPALDPLNSKEIKGCSLVVKKVESLKDAEQCQVIFICASEKAHLPEMISQLKNVRVLTVSEVDGFAEQGGIINFVSERNKVRFEINPEAAKRTGLTISSELLKLAKLVKP